MDGVVDQVAAIAKDVAYIRHMIEGDEFSAGMLEQVKSNTRAIDAMRKKEDSNGYSSRTFVATSWLFMLMALFATIADRLILISDVRHLLPFTTAQSVVLSIVMGLSAKVFVAIPIAIFVYVVTTRGGLK